MQTNSIQLEETSKKNKISNIPNKQRVPIQMTFISKHTTNEENNSTQCKHIVNGK